MAKPKICGFKRGSVRLKNHNSYWSRSGWPDLLVISTGPQFYCKILRGLAGKWHLSVSIHKHSLNAVAAAHVTSKHLKLAFVSCGHLFFCDDMPTQPASCSKKTGQQKPADTSFTSQPSHPCGTKANEKDQSLIQEHSVVIPTLSTFFFQQWWAKKRQVGYLGLSGLD